MKDFEGLRVKEVMSNGITTKFYNYAEGEIVDSVSFGKSGVSDGKFKSFEFLKGEVILDVNCVYNDFEDNLVGITLNFKSGNKLHIGHDRNLNEFVQSINVSKEDVRGLIGQEIYEFEAVSKHYESEVNLTDGKALRTSNTITTVFISTLIDTVVIRWNNNSNGCYSEVMSLEYRDSLNALIFKERSL